MGALGESQDRAQVKQETQNKQAIGQAGAVGTTMKQSGTKEISPQMQKQMEDFQVILMKIIHAPETRDDIVEMLSSAPPEQSLPYTSLQVFGMAEGKIADKTGRPVSQEVKLAGVIYLVGDLIELGNAAADFGIQEEQAGGYLEDTMTQYIHKGLADGSIDPVQLQQDTEPLLNQAQQDVGIALQGELGLPEAPTAEMGMQRIKQDARKPLEQENKKLQGQLRGQQAQQQVASQGQPQGQPPQGV